MCILGNKIKGKRKLTGYKVVVKRNGKYYSPATGVKYKQNSPVLRPKRFKPIGDGWNNNFRKFIFKNGKFYDKNNLNTPYISSSVKYGCIHFNYYGYTSIFKSKKDVENYILGIDYNANIETVILEMTISVDLHNSIYNYYNPIELYSGKKIVSFKEIK